MHDITIPHTSLQCSIPQLSNDVSHNGVHTVRASLGVFVEATVKTSFGASVYLNCIREHPLSSVVLQERNIVLSIFGTPSPLRGNPYFDSHCEKYSQHMKLYLNKALHQLLYWKIAHILLFIFRKYNAWISVKNLKGNVKIRRYIKCFLVMCTMLY